MRKLLETLIIIGLFTYPLSLIVNAEDIRSINDLIVKAKEFDAQRVTVQGEAIGERMDRGDYSWVNINDGTNAIGIWLNKSEAIKILRYGNYKNKGDSVKITGTFNRACKEHGGEADIHSNSIEIVEDGYLIVEQISSAKKITAVILTIIALLFSLYFFRQLKRNEAR